MSRRKGVPNNRHQAQVQAQARQDGTQQQVGAAMAPVTTPPPPQSPPGIVKLQPHHPSPAAGSNGSLRTATPLWALPSPPNPPASYHVSPDNIIDNHYSNTPYLPSNMPMPTAMSMHAVRPPPPPPPVPTSYNPLVSSFPGAHPMPPPHHQSPYVLSPATSTFSRPYTATTAATTMLYATSPPAAVTQPRPPLKAPLFPPGLDRYAQCYVPQWQQDVNQATQLYFIPQLPPNGHQNLYNWDELFPRKLLADLDAVEATHRALIVSSLPPINFGGTPQPPSHLDSAPVIPSSRIIPVRPGDPPQPVAPPPPITLPVPAVSLEDELRNKISKLTPDTYAQHWIPLQHAEVEARVKQLYDARMYAVPISRVPLPSSGPVSPQTPRLYVLQALSVREGWPPVELGDSLELRQLRLQQRFVNGQNTSSGTWQGFVFEATIASVNRAKGEVLLRCDGLANHEESMIFNVIWRSRHWRRATERISMAIGAGRESEATTRSVAQSWLFPEKDDCRQEDEDGIFVTYRGIDGSLNKEQRDAVTSILWAKHKVPFLISGPPGTGKTKTLVEAVLQLLRSKRKALFTAARFPCKDRDSTSPFIPTEHPTTHILVCGASGPSADTLCMRLRSLKPTELFRMNAPSRPFAEVRGELLPFCHVEDGNFALPSLPELLSKRVIVCSLVDAAMLLYARCSNHDLNELLLYTHKAVHPLHPVENPSPHFGFLLVDEAAQASEPDLACALSVVAVDPLRSSGRPHVTICGDPKQLGPVIVSQEARFQGLDVSLLERLAQRNLYAQHPCARNRKQENPHAVWTLGTPFVDLVKNYRSAVPILMLPSTLYYNETLEPCAAPTVQNSPLHNWSGLPRRGWPIIFHGITGRDEPIDEGASFYNQEEVDQVVRYITSLVSSTSGSEHGPIHAREISVISPYRGQVWKIRLALRSLGLHDVDVGNVEALQGAENRIVIISSVRSDRRWMAADRAHARGLIHEPKRFNVAMTRAKELLIVVGNPNALLVDSDWAAFYQFCRRNDAYVGVSIESHSRSDDVTASAQAVSKLEQQWHATHQNGSKPTKNSTYANGHGRGRSIPTHRSSCWPDGECNIGEGVIRGPRKSFMVHILTLANEPSLRHSHVAQLI
ncbi:BQ2448_2679 [Microbotryum intermedium]|uniref:BQ2448_2679 protein n=1 Tax=Microbotryum intermedium TaxID=269621 RepID=A0A238FG40_9BASI|nr:BQ2448_2679 [Microbotryum intermedium]